MGQILILCLEYKIDVQDTQLLLSVNADFCLWWACWSTWVINSNEFVIDTTRIPSRAPKRSDAFHFLLKSVPINLKKAAAFIDGTVSPCTVTSTVLSCVCVCVSVHVWVLTRTCGDLHSFVFYLIMVLQSRVIRCFLSRTWAGPHPPHLTAYTQTHTHEHRSLHACGGGLFEEGS